MLKKELESIIEHSYNRLIKMADPPVRYWLLKYVRGKGDEDSDVQRALEEAESYPPRVRMLDAMREDGTWPISKTRRREEDGGHGPPHGWTYMTMLRNLDWLHYYCVSTDDGHVENALDKILDWQVEEGYIPGPVVDRIPRTYYNGIALSIVLKYGRPRNDLRVSKLIDWLMRMQRHDDGWNIPYIQDAKYQPGYKHMRMKDFIDLVERGEVPYNPKDFDHVPSCYWSTVGVLTGMVWMLDDPRTEVARRGGNLILDGFFRRNPHPSFYRSEEHWTTLKYPSFSGSGYWALDTVLWLGYGPEDPRTVKPIQWLMNARDKDGFWYNKERPDRRSDQWITSMALMILHHYESLM